MITITYDCTDFALYSRVACALSVVTRPVFPSASTQVNCTEQWASGKLRLAVAS
jgi:hypothetical protein